MTLTNRLGLDYRSDGDQNWGDAHRNIRLMLDRYLCPENVFFVSPNYTAGNLHLSGTPSDRRHFATIQEAIDAWEAGGYGDNYSGVILVRPGIYSENLEITKSVAIVATHVDPTEGSGAHRGVLIAGSSGVLASTITVTPAAGASIRVLFGLCAFRNQVAAQGGTISNAAPMLLKTSDQGAGNYGASKSRVIFDHCNMILVSGNNNSWNRAVTVDPHNWVAFERCKMMLPGAASGYQMQYGVVVNRNLDTEKAGHLSMHDCRVWHGLTAPATTYTIAADSGCSGLVHRCTFNRTDADPRVRSTGASNAIAGLGVDYAAYGNIYGLDVVEA